MRDDILKDEQANIELTDSQMEMVERCPNDGSPMVEVQVPNGRDDYDRALKCPVCGLILS